LPIFRLPIPDFGCYRSVGGEKQSAIGNRKSATNDLSLTKAIIAVFNKLQLIE
jgi:hypothetical protein